ncbi:hypothetical protein B484DRAFT_456693 [Ochromonadaceae sp. CCMP2298]|nr:hypothetical protein B484DRAFT_456693 [Ochromonadaceae sp. CCMP2298]|mmetsp:Transcript_24663/g.53329  ORF Transcript_24663/g.53329 Transcript_24663/m.53329 type:complete len:107 (-) Transcript_24663:598-918(-)
MSGEPTETNDESKEMLALPAPSDLEETGTTAALDFLGPIIVNTDGTMGRIPNWAGMPEAERQKTFRLIGARNKRRTDALKTDALKVEAKVEAKEEDERILEAEAEA